MNQVYFVKTRTMLIPNFYDAYKDMFRLAELAGYPTIFIDEVDPASDNTYIISPLNGEWNHGWVNPKAQIVAWDLEWRLKSGGHSWSESDLTIPPGVKRVWASDKWYAGIIGAEYVPLGSHAEFRLQEAPDTQTYDAATMACNSQDNGRQTIFDTLLRAGLSIAPLAWNPARDSILKSSRVMLHTHQWRTINTVAPLRYAIAAAYGMPLISEPVEDASIFKDNVLFCEAEHLPNYISTLTLRYEDKLADYGQRLYECLTGEYSFRNCVEAAL